MEVTQTFLQTLLDDVKNNKEFSALIERGKQNLKNLP